MKARLQFEVRSEQVGMVESVRQLVVEALDEVSAETETLNELEVIARRHPGGIGFGHPLVRFTRNVMETLEIKPRILPSVGELAALISKGIPGVTLGVTTGDNIHEVNESIDINGIFSGLAQVIGVLQAIDRGICDEH